jgi:hypothetical protein
MTKCLTLLGITLLWASTLSAQTTSATIVGAVTDQSGSVVAGATVTVRNETTGDTRKVTTNSEGMYTASILPIGRYTVDVEASGFKRSVAGGLTLEVNQTVRVDLQLEVGPVTQTVEVTSAAVLVKTDRSDVGQVIDGKQVVELPLNGRKFIQLATLGPGAIPVQKVDDIMQTFGGGIIANGASSNANQITLDGVENQDFLVPRVGVSPSPDAIAEFKVMGATYSAEYGRGAGANINVVIRSGTNDIHGGGFWFHRNDNLDARNFFGITALPEFKRNQFGGTIGGPIVKNKTFYFGSYEGLRRGRGLTVNAIVPTDAQRSGDLSVGAPIWDPLTTATAGGQTTRTPFAGNRIPANRIAAESAKSLDLLYPRSQSQIADIPNFVYNPVEREKQEQVIFRLDHRISSRDSIWGRYAYNRNPRLLPNFNSSGLPVGGTDFGFNQRNYVAGYTKIISPTVVNEARIGYNYFHQDLKTAVRNRDLVGEIGIQGVLQDPLTWGPPNINITGQTGVGAFQFAPSQPRSHSFEFIDTLALTKGRHNMKTGADFRRGRMNGTQFPTPRGVYSFGGGYSQNPASRGGTGQGVADFLLGFPSGTSVQLGRTDNDIRTLNGGIFFQDDWNIARTVTLNLGVRYNVMPQPVSAADRIANWSEEHKAIILAETNLDKPTACAGCNGRSYKSIIEDWRGIYQFKTRAEVGWGRALAKSDWNNIEPRVGVAWRFLGDNDTVLRAGWGRFYEIVAGNVMWNYTTNPPLSRNLAFTGDINAVPLLTLRTPFPGSGIQGAPGLSGGIMYDWQDPRQDNFNVTLQRRLISTTSLELAYVGSRGSGQRMGVDFNSPRFGTGGIQQRRPAPERGGAGINVPWGHRRYNSMQVKLETQAKSLNLLAAYTWARGITWGGGGINENLAGTRFGWNFFGFRTPVLSGIIDPDDRYLRIDRGPGAFDVRHRLVVSYVWDLPFGKGKMVNFAGPADWILGGWQLSGITLFEGGVPLAVGINIDNTGGLGTRPDQVGNPNSGGRDAPLRWFNTTAFAPPTPMAQVLASGADPTVAAGNAGRAPIIGPGIKQWDLGIYKNFQFRERMRWQIRGEMFNAFNHVNWGNPNTTFGTPTFGRITGALQAREVQVALKFNF